MPGTIVDDLIALKIKGLGWTAMRVLFAIGNGCS
jgi:hypothetical protein